MSYIIHTAFAVRCGTCCTWKIRHDKNQYEKCV